MRIAFFGLPLAGYLLARDGHEIVFAGLSRRRSPGERRLRRFVGAERVRVVPKVDDPAVVRAVKEAAPGLLVSWFWTTKLTPAIAHRGAAGCVRRAPLAPAAAPRSRSVLLDTRSRRRQSPASRRIAWRTSTTPARSWRGASSRSIPPGRRCAWPRRSTARRWRCSARRHAPSRRRSASGSPAGRWHRRRSPPSRPTPSSRSTGPGLSTRCSVWCAPPPPGQGRTPSSAIARSPSSALPARASR